MEQCSFFLPVCTIVCGFEPNDSEPRLFWVQPGFIVCLYQLASEGGVRINDPLPVSNGKDITKIKDTLKVYKRISNNIRKLLTKKYFRIY